MVERKLVLAFEYVYDGEVPIVAIIPATRGVANEVPDLSAFAYDWVPRKKSVEIGM